MGRKILSGLKKDWQLWAMILPALAYIRNTARIS